jgi:pimeloyl-ACP methyl ester carboxylesterase
MARQARLLRHDLFRVVPREAPGDIVVLVHGFLATAGVLRPLAERLEEEAGVGTASFTHLPGEGIERIAERVADIVSRLPRTASRLHLVGHSIGGLAARLYATEPRADPRIVQTISLASPFEGVRRARLLPGRLRRDLDPESRLLARLREGLEGGVPHFSVAGSHDAVVGTGAIGLAQDRLLAPGCGHNAVLYDPVVLGEVAHRVRAAQAEALR